MEGFRDTYTKAAQITVVSPGALSSGKMMAKIAPPIPQGLLDMIEYAGRAMMEVIGLTPEFMGLVDSKLQTAKLNSQIVRQGLMVLAPYYDSIALFTRTDGIMFLDILRLLLENEPGRLIGHVTPEGNQVNVPLFEHNLCPEYDVVVEDVPMTPDERQETFGKLMELSQILLAKPNPTDITPITIDYAPLKPNEIAAVKTLLEPQEAPPPDPLQQALLESEVQLKQSLAKKQDAEAGKASMDTLLKQKELEHKDMEIDTDIVKKMTSAQYDKARTAKEWENLGLDRQKMHADHEFRSAKH